MFAIAIGTVLVLRRFNLKIINLRVLCSCHTQEIQAPSKWTVDLRSRRFKFEVGLCNLIMEDLLGIVKVRVVDI